MIRSIFLSVALATAAATSAQQLEQLDRIVAIVDEDVILQSELDRAQEQIRQQIIASGVGSPPAAELREQVLERLISQRLQIQYAEATGIRVSDTEVDDALRNIADQNRLNVSQLRQAIEADGFDFSQFRDDLRDELVTQQARNRIVSNAVEVGETEIDIYLASEAPGEGEVRLSHLLISVPQSATPDEVEAARTRVEDIYREIGDGLDFTTAAVRYSDGQQALEGGDLGWRPVAQAPTMIVDQIRDMQIGDVSQPVRSASGFHIVKVTDRRNEVMQMVEEVRARQIMIEVDELTSSSEALDRVGRIRDRILDGELDFDRAAREFSDDANTRNLGGDLNWFPPPALGPQFEQVITGLEVDEVSQPFRSASGWHILQVTDVRQQDRTEDFRRMQARDAIRTRKAEEEIELWLRRIRDEAFIDMKVQS